MRSPSASRTVKQAAALPFRDLGGQLEICLLTTRKEARMRGRVVGSPVGYYEITKGGVRYTVAVYLLHVDRVDAQWDEQDLRTRRWASSKSAPWRPCLGKG